MQQAVEHGADGGCVAQQLAPVFDWAVRGQHGAGPLVAAHDDLQQFLGGGERQLAHAQIIDDQQGHGHQKLHVFFACTVKRSVGQFIEQSVGFAVEHAVSLLNGSLSDGLRQVTFARAGRT